MQATLAVPSRAEALQAQTRRLNHELNLLLPLLIGGLAILLAIALGDSTLWLLVGLAVAWLILNEPRWGLYLCMAATAADAVPYDPFTAHMLILYRGLGPLHATRLELLMLWTCVSWILSTRSANQMLLPNRTQLISSGLFTFLVIASIVNGLAHGAVFANALWETRALLAILPLMLLTCGLLTQRRHLLELGAIVLIALTLMTIEQAWRYLTLVRLNDSLGSVEGAFNHDGAMLVGVLAILGAAGVTWGTHKTQRLGSLALCLMAIVVVLVSRRRAAVIGIEVGFITLGVVLLLTNWRRFMILAPVGLVLSALYMAAFWNNANTFGQPARAIRSAISSSSQSDRDKSSDDYRIIEKKDVWLDIKANALQGSGFGVAYAKPIPLTDLSKLWPFWDYTPHDNVLGIWLKGGVFLFISFWFLVGTAISQAVTTARKVGSPALVGVIACICAFFVMSVVFAYVDLGLTTPRLMFPFGVCLGLLSVIERLWLTDSPAIEP